MQESKYRVNEIDFAVKRWNEGAYPTLALHGWLDNAASFDELAPRLTQLELCAMDMAGHGLSSHRPPGCRYHYVDNVDDASGVADAMGWKKFAVIGHSMGAGVASYLAAVQNDRVSHAIFIEGLGGLSGAPGNTTQTLRQAVADMKRVRKKRMPLYDDVEAAVQMRMKGVGFTLSHNSARLLCERGLKKVENGVTWCSDPRLKTSSALRATEEQVCDLVGSMEMPSLLILGDRGIKLSAMNFDKRILAHKNLVVKNIPGGHHLHMEEQSMKVAEIISDFLKENGIPLT